MSQIFEEDRVVPVTVLEVGPGNVLAGLMKRIVVGVEVVSLSKAEELDAAANFS